MKFFKKYSFLVILVLVGTLYVLVSYPLWITQTSEDFYVIERTQNYPYSVKSIE